MVIQEDLYEYQFTIISFISHGMYLFLLHQYVDPCNKCLYHVIIVKPKVVSWYNEYDSWVFVLIKNQIGIHLQAMDVVLLVDKMRFEI